MLSQAWVIEIKKSCLHEVGEPSIFMYKCSWQHTQKLNLMELCYSVLCKLPHPIFSIILDFQYQLVPYRRDVHTTQKLSMTKGQTEQLSIHRQQISSDCFWHAVSKVPHHHLAWPLAQRHEPNLFSLVYTKRQVEMNLWTGLPCHVLSPHSFSC